MFVTVFRITISRSSISANVLLFVTLAAIELCEDDNTGLQEEIQLDCAGAALLQLCRNTPTVLHCTDDDAGLLRHTVSMESCAIAVANNGCTTNPVVAQWCPKSCSICPVTIERTKAIEAVRTFCPKACNLCLGTTRYDCLGAFGAWDQCTNCWNQRVYKVTRPRRDDGMECPFKDSEVQRRNCCGPGTRWRVSAASSVPSFWEVHSIAFYEESPPGSHMSGKCEDGKLITIRTARPVGSGSDGTLLPVSDMASDPERLNSSICIDCCTKSEIGPIASGSAPSPYGCENALMSVSKRQGASWRSQCGPCDFGEAWLGFRTEGNPAHVKCVVINQRVNGYGHGMEHSPSKLWLERWDGTSWKWIATAEGGHRWSNRARVVIVVNGKRPTPLSWRLVAFFSLLIVLAVFTYTCSARLNYVFTLCCRGDGMESDLEREQTDLGSMKGVSSDCEDSRLPLMAE